eukprot:6436495-Amphidinium_carterae.1
MYCVVTALTSSGICGRQQRAASSAAGSGCKAPMTTYEGSSCDSLQFLQNTPQQGVSRHRVLCACREVATLCCFSVCLLHCALSAIGT